MGMSAHILQSHSPSTKKFPYRYCIKYFRISTPPPPPPPPPPFHMHHLLHWLVFTIECLHRLRPIITLSSHHHPVQSSSPCPVHPSGLTAREGGGGYIHKHHRGESGLTAREEGGGYIHKHHRGESGLTAREGGGGIYINTTLVNQVLPRGRGGGGYYT